LTLLAERPKMFVDFTHLMLIQGVTPVNLWPSIQTWGYLFATYSMGLLYLHSLLYRYLWKKQYTVK